MVPYLPMSLVDDIEVMLDKAPVPKYCDKNGVPLFSLFFSGHASSPCHRDQRLVSVRSLLTFSDKIGADF